MLGHAREFGEDLRIARRSGQCGFEMSASARGVGVFVQQTAEIEVRQRMLWIQAQRLFLGGARLGAAPQDMQAEAAIDPALHRVRVQGQQALERRERFIAALGGGQTDAQIEPGRAPGRALLHDLAIGRDGLVQTIRGAQRMREAVARFGVVGLQLQGQTQGRQRFGAAPQIVQGATGVMLRRGQFGMRAQHGLEGGQGRGRIALQLAFDGADAHGSGLSTGEQVRPGRAARVPDVQAALPPRPIRAGAGRRRGLAHGSGA
ncbi:MAG: hypothetical protein LKM32_09160 [Chiayiivirga sp.]|nr:hypothetical protein [Chiayiivirga sp.]MCI1729523.1 hypothetical protein [Chiayiivirga sp.]